MDLLTLLQLSYIESVEVQLSYANVSYSAQHYKPLEEYNYILFTI